MSEFTHPEAGWSITAPDEWERVDHPVAPFVAVEPPREDGRFRMNVNVVPQPIRAGTSSDAYTDAQVAGLRQADPGALIIEATPGAHPELCVLTLSTVAEDESRLTILQHHLRDGDEIALVCTLTVETFEFGVRQTEALEILRSLAVPSA